MVHCRCCRYYSALSFFVYTRGSYKFNIHSLLNKSKCQKNVPLSFLSRSNAEDASADKCSLCYTPSHVAPVLLWHPRLERRLLDHTSTHTPIQITVSMYVHMCISTELLHCYFANIMCTQIRLFMTVMHKG